MSEKLTTIKDKELSPEQLSVISNAVEEFIRTFEYLENAFDIAERPHCIALHDRACSFLYALLSNHSTNQAVLRRLHQQISKLRNGNKRETLRNIINVQLNKLDFVTPEGRKWACRQSAATIQDVQDCGFNIKDIKLGHRQFGENGKEEHFLTATEIFALYNQTKNAEKTESENNTTHQ